MTDMRCSRSLTPANECLVMMFTENAVWQRACPSSSMGRLKFLQHSVERLYGVVIQCLVDAGNGFHLLQYSADVVTDKGDGAFFVNLRQQFVETGFEAFVDIRAGSSRMLPKGREWHVPAVRVALPPSLSDGTVFESHRNYTGGDALAFSLCSSKRVISECIVRKVSLLYRNRNFRSMVLYCGR